MGIDFDENDFLEKVKQCKIGDNVSIKPTVLFDKSYNIEIGDNSKIGNYCNLRPVDHKIIIGKNVLIAQMVSIIPDSHCFKDITVNICDQAFFGGDVIIEDNVWIGCNSVILHNLTIGKGSVVAAGSIVTKTIPPYSVVAGNPARIIKRYSFKLGKWINYRNLFIRRLFKLGII